MALWPGIDPILITEPALFRLPCDWMHCSAQGTDASSAVVAEHLFPQPCARDTVR